LTNDDDTSSGLRPSSPPALRRRGIEAKRFVPGSGLIVCLARRSGAQVHAHESARAVAALQDLGGRATILQCAMSMLLIYNNLDSIAHPKDC
jgi:hypothetical protein